MKDNPEFKGEWIAKRISNPAYKGFWEAKKIANPEYEDDDSVYKYADFGFIGFDLWQVKGGTIFDNVIITDDVAEADTFVKKWKELSEVEKTKKKEEEDSKKADDKKKEDEDPDRWLKMRLEGEEKPKKIDATRVVHYHDFDTSDLSVSRAVPLEASTVVTDEKPTATPGSFRSTLRRDLFDDSDDDAA